MWEGPVQRQRTCPVVSSSLRKEISCGPRGGKFAGWSFSMRIQIVKAWCSVLWWCMCVQRVWCVCLCNVCTGSLVCASVSCWCVFGVVSGCLCLSLCLVVVLSLFSCVVWCWCSWRVCVCLLLFCHITAQWCAKHLQTHTRTPTPHYT